MHAACEPSIVFDPYSQQSIVKAMEQAAFGKFNNTSQKMFNEIDNLIKLLD